MSFRNGRRPGKIIFIPFAIAAFVLGMGGVVMWLWNAILPDLLRVSRITFWQSVGLLVLCRILFGNFGKGGAKHGGPGMMHPRGRAMREKWLQMSQEEKQQFKDEWKERCRNWTGKS